MDPKQVKRFLHKVVANPGTWDKDGNWKPTTPAIFLWGPPGIGKSAIPKQIASEEKIGFLDTRASQHDPTDFRGIPAVIDGKAEWLPPQDIPYIGNDLLPERGIWLLDELTSAPPLVQAVLYQATLDHRIGEHLLKAGWTVIAAGNRIEDRAVVYRMSTALANRFTHIEFEVNLEAWSDWALRSGVDPNIVGYINYKPEVLFSFNPESSEKAFPTPRSWEFASKIMQLGLNQQMFTETLNGTIGQGATAEFMSFLRLQTELPDIDEIFKGSDFVPKKLDLKYALVAALAAKATKKQFERLLQYSEKLPVEFSVLMVMMMVGRDAKAVSDCDGWEKWAKEHKDVLVKKRNG